MPPPRIVVVEDVDERPGLGAFVGDVHAQHPAGARVRGVRDERIGPRSRRRRTARLPVLRVRTSRCPMPSCTSWTSSAGDGRRPARGDRRSCSATARRAVDSAGDRRADPGRGRPHERAGAAHHRVLPITALLARRPSNSREATGMNQIDRRFVAGGGGVRRRGARRGVLAAARGGRRRPTRPTVAVVKSHAWRPVADADADGGVPAVSGDRRPRQGRRLREVDQRRRRRSRQRRAAAGGARGPGDAGRMRTGEASATASSEEINRAQADLDRTQSVHELAHLSARRASTA